ncbi:GNAT family N-acetyltransferase [Hydrogenimonas thermophila]|uniref:Acetyltransferase (GNAT) domain-containing protein n=1 Tax=Hydrogenimonas thermophila TaxID=223786 RepID=A0A1I5U0L1_9BACT|nr:GNAT family N-acetyltransferase [Hydrogenimonas thermophila]SFP88814.1 Acetyltransferase (GNAT) domain-containing protein [Hydrogenimonas thermophila]
MNIEYKLNPKLTASEFIDILNRSTLGERRPVDDIECIDGMLKNADITIVAIYNKKIIGVARSVTDYNYCCYLSDLAVDKKYQKHGIGKKLIDMTQKQLNKKCKIILLSAPNATEYYPKIGFTQHASAWTLARDKKLT